jgi:phosphonate dehydrogenase
MLPTVVITNWVHPEVIERLSPHATPRANDRREEAWTRERTLSTCAGAEALLAFMNDHVDEAFLEACPSLRMIGCALKGYDNFDVDACHRRGVTVSIVPDLLTNPTAELAVGLMIALGRHVITGNARMRAGTFRGWRPQLYGTGLDGSTVGLVGMGAVGQAIARRLQPFGCRLIHHDLRPLAEEESRGFETTAVDLETLAARSDYVVVAAPLTERTRHLIDGAFLAAMKQGGLLINVGRGSVVDEAAVADALTSGWLGGYAADVYEMEDWARPDRPGRVHPGLTTGPGHTVLTPHLGSAVDRIRLDITLRAADNIIQFLSGRRPMDALPEPRSSLA